MPTRWKDHFELAVAERASDLNRHRCGRHHSSVHVNRTRNVERQREIYERGLLDRCHAIAEGKAHNRDCPILAVEGRGTSYIRVDEHFLVHIETSEAIIVVYVPHSRSSLLNQIARLTEN